VCLGNHEADVGNEALRERIVSSKLTHFNTNVPTLNEKLHISVSKTVPEAVISVASSSSTNQGRERKIALLGLLTEDPSLYRLRAFADAHIVPILDATDKYLKEKRQEQFDLIIPLTHRGIIQDREFCQRFGGNTFPVVLGGHDHEFFEETVNGSRILKTG